jgi:hypothetical protein
MDDATPGTQRKALALNLDPVTYGVFAEAGGGQEVARWFFEVGGAAGTVAKTISAYDMAMGDALYGPTQRYVSRQRLEAMLEHEFAQLTEQLGQRRGDATAFFAFADTVATRSYRHPEHGRGWVGIRFQARPHDSASEIIIHVHLLDATAAHQREALGVLGVNLIHGAVFTRQDPSALIGSLIDDLSRGRVEIDMIEFSGPAFRNVDNRLMTLQLVEQGLTAAASWRRVEKWCSRQKFSTRGRSWWSGAASDPPRNSRSTCSSRPGHNSSRNRVWRGRSRSCWPR